jgi:predicted SAM-dependent methyltransferase
MLRHYLTMFHSLYANPAEYYTLPEKDRFKRWAVGTRDVSREFAARSQGKVVLDLGCGPTDRRDAVAGISWAQYIGLDFDLVNLPDLTASANRLCLRDESVDSISCFSVLEHVYRPMEILAEMFRVLRPGGCVQVQVPFLLQYHGYPDDYFRYTHTALQRMFEEAGFRVPLLETDWTKGAFLNAAKMLEDGSWDIAKPRWRLVARLLALLLFRLNKVVDKYYAQDKRGMYHALCLLAEKPVRSYNQLRIWECSPIPVDVQH